MSPPSRIVPALLASAVLGCGAWLLLAPEGTVPDPGIASWASDAEVAAGPVAELAGDEIEAAPGTTEEPPESRERVEGAGDRPPPDPGVRLRVNGRVVDTKGLPIAGAEVGLWLRPGRPRGRAGQSWRAWWFRSAGERQRTAADGSFAFDVPGFARAALQVAARHERFSPAVAGKEWRADQGTLELEPLVLQDGATVFGRVIAKAGGAPLGKVKVSFGTASRALGRLNELVEPASSDERGTFELRGVPPGEFRLHLERDGYIPAWTANLGAKPGAKLDAGTLEIEKGSSVTGVVLDTKGAPIAGATVEGTQSEAGEVEKLQQRMRDLEVLARATPGARNRSREAGRELAQTYRARRWVRARAKTDDRGRFVLGGLPNTSLRLVVRHERYIDETRDPLPASPSQRVEIRMFRRLALAGVVRDARTGQAVRVFGIKPRRVGAPGQPSGPAERQRHRMEAERAKIDARRTEQSEARIGRLDRALQRKNLQQAQRERLLAARQAERDRRAKLEQQRAQRDLDRKSREAERRARQQRQRAFLKERLGPSGQLPGPIPQPTAHEGGEFLLEGLLPGRYVLDAGGPGYVKLAAGPFELVRGQPLPRVTIRLQPGQSIEGSVVNRVTGEPIAGADVELFLPPQETGPPPSDPMMRAMRPQALGMRIERAKTDAQGSFQIAPQKHGTYRLRASAEDYCPHVEDPLTVHAGQNLTGLMLQLGPGCRVWGTVANRKPDSRYQVVLASTDGTRKFVQVEAGTGRYEAKGLPPGDWFVRLNEEGRAGGWFRQAVEAMAKPGGTKPDLRLREGADVRFHLDAAADSLGSVAGRIVWNGAPARGLELRLVPQEGTLPAPDLARGEGERLMRRVLGGILRAATDKDGKFALEMVPPGAYDLEVRVAGRRGETRGRRDGVLHRRRVLVSVGRAERVTIHLVTGNLKIVVERTDGKAPRGARVMLALATDVAGKEPRTWREVPSFRHVPIRGNAAEVRDLPAGEYAWFVYGGVQSQGGRHFVGSGDGEPLRLRVEPRRRGGARTRPRRKKG